MSEIAIQEQMNGFRGDGTGRQLKLMGQDCSRESHSMTVYERQMRTGETIPSSHEQYFPFILGPFLVISHHFSLNYQKLSKSSYRNIIHSHLCNVNIICSHS